MYVLYVRWVDVNFFDFSSFFFRGQIWLQYGWHTERIVSQDLWAQYQCLELRWTTQTHGLRCQNSWSSINSPQFLCNISSIWSGATEVMRWIGWFFHVYCLKHSETFQLGQPSRRHLSCSLMQHSIFRVRTGNFDIMLCFPRATHVKIFCRGFGDVSHGDFNANIVYKWIIIGQKREILLLNTFQLVCTCLRAMYAKYHLISKTRALHGAICSRIQDDTAFKY